MLKQHIKIFIWLVQLTLETLYLEIKGYERERDQCKWKVIENLIVIKSDKIKLIKENKITIEIYLLNLIHCRKGNWLHVSSILTISTNKTLK